MRATDEAYLPKLASLAQKSWHEAVFKCVTVFSAIKGIPFWIN